MRALMTAAAAFLAGTAVSGCSFHAGPSPVRSFSRTVLSVQHLQQEPLLCVPTSAAMVLAFYGDPRPPRFLKSLAAGRFYDPNVPFTDFTITSYDGIIKAVRSLGYGWVQHTYDNDDSGFHSGLILIESELRNGHPVLVDATLPSGHTFVMRGFDTDMKTLFAVDPNEPAPGEREISFDEFRTVWNENAYGNNIRSLIVTQPNSGNVVAS